MQESNATFGSKAFKRAYLIGAVVVWVGIVIGTAVILSGTPYFAQMLPLLSAGVIWFIVILPGSYFWAYPKPDHPHPIRGAE